jgi:hypothetical protein
LMLKQPNTVTVAPTGASNIDSVPNLPIVAGAQARLKIIAIWPCIGEGGCWCVTRPAVESIALNVCLTAIAWDPVTVGSPARAAAECHAEVEFKPK